jgi:hypothetical protein
LLQLETSSEILLDCAESVILLLPAAGPGALGDRLLALSLRSVVTRVSILPFNFQTWLLRSHWYGLILASIVRNVATAVTFKKGARASKAFEFDYGDCVFNLTTLLARSWLAPQLIHGCAMPDFLRIYLSSNLNVSRHFKITCNAFRSDSLNLYTLL